MTPRKKPRTHVMLAGRSVPLLEAALMAQEADRRGVLPRKVRRVALPQPAPTHVVISGQRLSLEAAAIFAREADARGVLLGALISDVLNKQAPRLERRAKQGKTRKTVAKTSKPRRDSAEDDPPGP